MAILNQWLDVKLFNNTVQDYAISTATLIGLIFVLFLAKRLIVSVIQKVARKTETGFDDFMAELISQIGAPTFIAVALYFSTLTLALDEKLRNLIRYGLVIIITIRLIFLLQEIV